LLAGERVATRVSGNRAGGNNGLFFVYSDHLGSTSVLANRSNGVVSGSTARYSHFSAPTAPRPPRRLRTGNSPGTSTTMIWA
jgi:hypothetical protein